MSLLAIASDVISSAQLRLETAAQNLANAATYGYKRKISFAELLSGQSTATTGLLPQSAIDFAPGKLVHTGNPTDLALTGPGFFNCAHRDRADLPAQRQLQPQR